MADKNENTLSGRKRRFKGKNIDSKDEASAGKYDQMELNESKAVSAKSETLKYTAQDEVKSNTENTDFVMQENQNKTKQLDMVIKKSTEKSREEILAEREAKRLAKAQKKKGKDINVNKINVTNEVTKINTPAEEKENRSGITKIEKLADDGKQDKVQNVSMNVIDGKKSQPTDKTKDEGKSKALLRAERRALQEAQRAKKLEKSKEINEGKSSPPKEVPKQERTMTKVMKILPSLTQDKIHKVKLFAHLYTDVFDCVDLDLSEIIHPCIIRLGTQYRSKVISGANARCLALLNAFKIVVNDYKTPPNQEFSRGLEAEISKNMSFLNKCRPIAVSMINAVKHLKFQVNQIKENENESKRLINEWIDTYIKDQIEKAAEAISLFVLEKITDGDVILTYSCSSLIQRALIKAHGENIKFRVIVVDGRPWLEGKEILRRLVKAGISCTYVFFNGLSFIMPEVTKILLGAHALLANGYVMSRAGSSQIALLAKTYNVPVLVCCETHKFNEKVQTDSFVHNELGDPDQLIRRKGSNCTELSKWRTMQYLTPLNLTYDVTPPDLVSAVVTEIAVLPCTSVPVILRVKPPDMT